MKSGIVALWIVVLSGLLTASLVCAALGEEMDWQPSEVQVEMLARNNSCRALKGLGAHQFDQRLCAAAQDHAEYMAKVGSMNHYSNGGPGGRAHRFGFAGGVTENIAYGQESVDAVYSTWWNSGGHYANLMGDNTRCGLGCAWRGGTPYWCAVYGSVKGDERLLPGKIIEWTRGAVSGVAGVARRGLLRRR